MDLTTTGVYLGGKYYGVVEDYPWDTVEEKGPDAFRKAVAYRYCDEFEMFGKVIKINLLLPYRGFMKEGAKKSKSNKDIGIWYRKSHGKNKKIIIFPGTKEEKEEYSLGKEKNIVFAVLNNEFQPNQFADNQLNMSDIGTDVYLPPIHVDDDPLNMLLKMGIRLKGASFAPYGKRLESMAADHKSGSEGANIRNNTKRAMLLNKTLTPSKMIQYADSWQFESAFILKDIPDAMHPMHIPKGKMLVVFPNGVPFKINSEDLIDITDMVAEVVSENTNEEMKEALAA